MQKLKGEGIRLAAEVFQSPGESEIQVMQYFRHAKSQPCMASTVGRGNLSS